MQFRILGPLEVDGRDGAVPLGGPRHRVILATLLTSPGRVIPAERLVDVLWGHTPPKRPVEMLHVRISELRKLLAPAAPDVIVTRRPGYLLDVPADDVDARRFEAGVTEAGRTLTCGDAAGAASRLRRVLGLWRGPALPEIAETEFAREYVARLDHLRVQAVEDRLAAALALGAHREVLADLEAAARQNPLHERYRYLLMLALYRDGRQSAALEVYADTAAQLRGELGVDPGPELQDLRLRILRHDGELAAPRAIAPTRGAAPDLPVPLTSFVGRDEEVELACAQLDAGRLVSLTGVGGAGKSRLAVEVAQVRREGFPDGVRIVELAAVEDPALVAATVAAAVGVRERPQESLRDAIVERLCAVSSLLVLDNCEHLVDEVASLTRFLLARCPGLHVLCTSRERLGITGERVLPVPGLPVPPSGADATRDLMQSGAVRLFVDRATAAQPRFRLTDDNAVAVCEITRRLDGLPLSLELAAARVGVLAAAQIVHELRDRFRLLSGGDREALPRHRTLRAVVEWSYELLTQDEKRLFVQLSVFVGGFSYDAVTAICGDGAGLLLARLVDKSLIVAESLDAQEYRYRMLETLREYGLAELDRNAIAGPTRDAHARHFRDLAVAASEGLRSPLLAGWLHRLRREHGNLRAAMDWSLSTGAGVVAAEVAASLFAFWDLRGYYAEGRQWIGRVLDEGGALDPALRARVLMGAATLAVIQGDLSSAATACGEAEDLARAAADGAGLAHALQYQGFVAVLLEDPVGARALLADAERISAGAGAGARWEHAWSHVFLSSFAFSESRFTDGERHGDRAEEIMGPDGDPELLAWAALIRGIAMWGQGRTADAVGHLIEGIGRFHVLEGRWGLSLALLGTGLVLARTDDLADAVSAISGSEKVRESAGIGTMPYTGEWLGVALEDLRTRLPPEEFDAHWVTGEGRTVEAMVQSARAGLTSLRIRLSEEAIGEG